jgi:hypothetical protein
MCTRPFRSGVEIAIEKLERYKLPDVSHILAELVRVVGEIVRFEVKNVSYTGLSKKTDGILNRYNLKSTGRIYTIGVLKSSEKFKVLDLP